MLIITLITCSLSYLFRASYLLICFVFSRGIQKNFEEFDDDIMNLIASLILVVLTEILPIISLIMTVLYLLSQKSSKLSTIGEKEQDLLDVQIDGNDSDLDEEENQERKRTKDIRSIIINEFIDKDDADSRYHYHMHNKNIGREIFWTYHFFEYVDDYIDNNSKFETTQHEKDTSDNRNAAEDSQELSMQDSNIRHSTRIKKNYIKELGKRQENKFQDVLSSIHSHNKSVNHSEK